MSDQAPSPGLHVSYLLGFLVAILSAGIVSKSRRAYLAELAEFDQSIEAVRTDAIGGERGQLLLREMMEDVGVGWYRMTADGALEAANLALAVMLGYDSVDALRAVCKGNSFAGSTDRTSALSALQSIGEIRNHSASWPTAHGRRARLLESARAVRDDTGRLRHIEGVAVLASHFESSAPITHEPDAEESEQPTYEAVQDERADIDAEDVEAAEAADSQDGKPGHPVRLRDLLEDTLEFAANLAEDRNLELGFRLADESTPEIQVDRGGLMEALRHTLDFAVRFTASGGIVTHGSLSRTSDDFYSAHFEFRSTNASDTPREVSSAFGSDGATSICDDAAASARTIIERMGGDLRFAPGPGEGYSIHVSIPVDPLPDAEPASRDELDGVVVLLVDDNPISSEFLSHQMDSTGATVLAADRPAEAARIVEDGGDIDVIVASLSNARGAAEFVGHLKKIDASRRPPLVLVVPSELRERSNGRSGSRLGKPVRRSELVHAILAALPDADESIDSVDEEASAPIQATSPARKSTPEPAPTRNGKPGSMSVLVAEDDPVNGRLMLYLLEGMGHEVVLVRTGDQAVSAFNDREFDAAIMDVRMPGLSGPDAARRILRNTSSRGSTPVLIGMTASTASWDRDACVSAGMRACLVKPLSTESIREALAIPAPAAVDRVRPDRPSQPPPRGRQSLREDSDEDMPAPVNSDDAMNEVRDYLESHHADEPAFSAELLAGFLRTAPGLVESVGDAYADGRADTLRDAARALRASCSQIGFARLSALCRTLEGVATDDADSEDLDPWVAAIHNTFDAVRPAFAAEQAELTHLAALQSAL